MVPPTVATCRSTAPTAIVELPNCSTRRAALLSTDWAPLGALERAEVTATIHREISCSVATIIERRPYRPSSGNWVFDAHIFFSSPGLTDDERAVKHH